MQSISGYLRTLWGPAWPLVFAPLGLLGLMVALDEARIEHHVVMVSITALAVAGRVGRDLLLAVVPGIAIAVGYEVVRYLRPLFVTPDRVWACEFDALDSALFGFRTGQTPADVFATLNAPLADLFFAIPYTTHWMVTMVYCGLLFLISRGRLRRFLWTLAAVHLAGFVLWMTIPVAPPWYVRAEGCAIDIAAAPSAAALARLDALYGITYFHDFYSRAPTVFGAFPSLHVVFPAAAMISGWQWSGTTGRVVTATMTLWMVVASVYLDHHWLVDGLATLVLTAAAHLALMRLWPGYRAPTPDAVWREGPR